MVQISARPTEPAIGSSRREVKAIGDVGAGLPGVIQLPPGGEPIVLMADAPTIGGYRIAGGVISADLGGLAQRRSGEAVTLEPTTIEEAQRSWSELRNDWPM